METPEGLSKIQLESIDSKNENVAPILIKTGYTPGVLARSLDMHMRYYSKFSGFGRKFELDLAAALENLLRRIDDPLNEVWAAMNGNSIIGTIFIDGTEDSSTGTQETPKIAKLRAFIVDPEFRGQGVGKMLMDKAMAFVDMNNFTETRLLTFKGLDAAKFLYEKAGFLLSEEELGTRWGEPVIEQLYVRKMK